MVLGRRRTGREIDVGEGEGSLYFNVDSHCRPAIRAAEEASSGEKISHEKTSVRGKIWICRQGRTFVTD